MSAIQFEDATSISYEVSEGEDVKLGCPTNEPAYFTALSFEHPPVPSFFLAPDGKKIIQEGQTFIISNVTQWNTGTYTCVVKDKELNNAELQVADIIVKSRMYRRRETMDFNFIVPLCSLYPGSHRQFSPYSRPQTARFSFGQHQEHGLWPQL